jgi:DNA mismatch endonuclease (patch repair protein)
MVDRLTPQHRSWLMSRVRSKNTTPELIVRRIAHALGYRFRLHSKDLPGKPDLVLPKYRAVIFVHGCFWHRHPKCRKASNPTTRIAFWVDKFERNVARDAENRRLLRRAKWRVLTIWECETKREDRLRRILQRFLAIEKK